MIWLTWRQFRTQALIGLAVVAAVVAVYVSTRGPLLALSRDMGYTGCTAGCDQFASQFVQAVQTQYFGSLLKVATIVTVLLPLLVGLFWGAPMVARELETGTHRLVWNQTVSRSRWLTVKLAAGVLASAVMAGLVTWAITAWASPIDRAGGWMAPETFTTRGLVPIGYAVFGFVAGVTVGMLMRRTVAAMAVTLVVVALGLFGAIALRPHLVTPTTYQAPLTAEMIGGIGLHMSDPDRDIRIEPEEPVRGAWILSNTVLTQTGSAYHGPYDPAKCGPDAPGQGPQGCKQWLASQNLKQKVIYLGAERFWALQWRELGVFLVVSALLASFCFWWIRRRVA